MRDDASDVMLDAWLAEPAPTTTPNEKDTTDMATPIRDDEWETIDVPRGAYISWGNRVGQHVTGRVADFDITGGVDQQGHTVPSLAVELTERAASINKEGERTDYEAGEMVQLTVSQVSLKRAMRAADPKSGDLIKITLASLVKATNGTVKEFDVKIARGRGGKPSVSRQPQPAAATASSDPWSDAPAPASGGFDDEPPF